MKSPVITSVTRERVSPWVELVAKTVRFRPAAEPEVFHCLSQSPYVGVIAQLPDGRIPLVRQFRPCVEDFTWEFPAGTVDDGETPGMSAKRELSEEAGLTALEMQSLGVLHPDTGRLEFPCYGFFCRTGPPTHGFVPEEGMEVRFVTLPELKEMVLANEFRHQLHLGYLAVAMIKGLL